MAEFPLPLAEMLGHWGSYVVYLIIGLAFGFFLESAGFGNSKKLAAQFYFKDLAVFKVMFTAIIVAMSLIFLATAMGVLDYNLIWVPPTYLWPGILGGFIMGVGFIIGGFCPGTSLVAVATAKVDGFYFVGGVLFGIFMFGETVSNFDVFFNSSYYSRFTLPELFEVSYGTVVLAVVLGALFCFWGAEKIEAARNRPETHVTPKWAFPAAASIAALAVVVLLVGQPDNEDRWQQIAAEKQPLLDDRLVQITPAELLNLTNDSKLKPILLDVRDEADYNQFHIHGARHLPMDQLLVESKDMLFELANTVFVLQGNDETRATEAWKVLKAESVPNVYLLEGGINNWLNTFASERFRSENALDQPADDQLGFRFHAALGDRFPAAEPQQSKFELGFEPKVILELKRAPTSGGCG
jgi:rhodanese-related sulfurtransferase